MTKNILLIGGLGYIGSVLYDFMKTEGWHIEILDNHLYKEIHPSNVYNDVDIRDKDSIKDIIENFEIIINLAGIVGDPACLIDTDLAIEINCIGVRNIVEVCKELNKKIIHLSTCSIYGSEPNKIVKEDDEGFPIDFYGQTKYTQERLVREICKDSYCIFRVGTAYGLSPRMRYDIVVNTFAARAIKYKKISVFGGKQERPFVHVRDISRAVIHAIKENLKGIYNLRAENLSILSLSDIIKEITNCKVEIKKEIIDKRSYLVDSSKIIKTGFEFKYSIADAINEISSSPTALEMHEKIYSNFKLAENLKVSNLLRKKEIEIINGGIAIDDRGFLIFANDFKFLGVKRFYQVSNFSKSVIRAFHGHLEEAKYIYIAKGSAIVAAVRLDNMESPSKNLEVQRFILSDKQPKILFIPPNYANGFKSLEDDTRIIIFSTSSLEEREGDDYRFPADYWGKKIWEVENR